jgi:hypothetical protein
VIFASVHHDGVPVAVSVNKRAASSVVLMIHLVVMREGLPRDGVCLPVWLKKLRNQMRTEGAESLTFTCLGHGPCLVKSGK